MTRHARIPPTREIFVPATNGTGQGTSGTHTGWLVNANNENALMEMFVPHDYHGIVEMAIAFISGGTLTPMTMNVTNTYGEVNEAANLNVWGPFQKSMNVGNNTIHEVDITELTRAGATIHGIEPGDYMGIALSRAADGSQNTNCLVLGVRMRYKVFKGR